jgi:hypothetical protein
LFYQYLTCIFISAFQREQLHLHADQIQKRITFSLRRSDAALLVTTKTRRIGDTMRIRIFVASACFEWPSEKIEPKQTLKTARMAVPTIYLPAPAGFH